MEWDLRVGWEMEVVEEIGVIGEGEDVIWLRMYAD